MMGGITRTQLGTITLVVTLYWCVSLSMVFVNYWQLNSAGFKDIPVFLTLSRCVLAVVTLSILGQAMKLSSSSTVFPLLDYQIATAKQVAPTSLMFVLMILLSNLTIQLLGMSFYISSLTPVFSALFSRFMLKQRISVPIAFCCGIIVSGFLMSAWEDNGSLPETRLWGLSYGIMASICNALYTILTQQTMPAVENNVLKLQMYNNVHASIFLVLVLAVTGELSSLRDQSALWISLWFWTMLFLTGGLGLAVGYVASLQILATSPLTHNISVATKTCVQTIIVYIVFSGSKSWLWWTGTVMGLGGSFVYAYQRVLEMRARSGALCDRGITMGETHSTNQHHNYCKKVD